MEDIKFPYILRNLFAKRLMKSKGAQVKVTADHEAMSYHYLLYTLLLRHLLRWWVSHSRRELEAGTRLRTWRHALHGTTRAPWHASTRHTHASTRCTVRLLTSDGPSIHSRAHALLGTRWPRLTHLSSWLNGLESW